MKRYDFFYRQKVKEAELDAAFDASEASDQAIVSALGLDGIVLGGGVTQNAPTPNLSVSVAGPVVGYDADGNRIYVAGSSTSIDVSVDENSASTAVATVGHERYLSLFVKFERVLSDPRLDGLGDTVYFVRDESYEFVVASGATAPLGTATRPALRAGHVLLADIKLVEGQTAVLDADISTDRTQYAIRLTGSPVSLTAKTFEEALQEVLDAVNDLANGTINLDASFVTYDNGTSGLAATEVQAAIDEIVAAFDLGLTLGAGLVDNAAEAETARLRITAAPTTIDSYCLTQETTTTNLLRKARVYVWDGSTFVFTGNASFDIDTGNWVADDTSVSAYRFAVNTNGQIEFFTKSNTTSPWTEASWEAELYASPTNGIDLEGTATYNYDPPRPTKLQVDPLSVRTNATWAHLPSISSGIALQTAEGEYLFSLVGVVPQDAVITAVRAGVLSAAGLANGSVHLLVRTVDDDAVPSVGSVTVSTGDAQSGNTAQMLEESGLSETVDWATKRYYILVDAPDDANTNNMELYNLSVSFNNPGPR